jgi:hypothetical protein
MKIMLSLRQVPRGAGVRFCSLCLAAAQSLSAAESFKLLTSTVHIPERGDVTGYVVQMEHDRFSFLPPPTWRLGSNSKEQQITMMPHDLSASIRVKMVSLGTSNSSGLDARQLRQEILTRFPDATDVKEFTCYTGASSGLAFDFKRTLKNRAKLATRLAFVPFSSGRIEFSLTASSSQFTNYHLAFGNLLTSFRIEPLTHEKSPSPPSPPTGAQKASL